MWDDDDAKPKRITPQPRPLAGLSIEELESYIATLKAEIARIEAELAKRRDIRGAAEALFKRSAS